MGEPPVILRVADPRPATPGRTGQDTVIAASVPPDIRPAEDGDIEFLLAHDRHVSAEVLTGLVAQGRVLVLEESGEICGWLRWSLFWDEIPFLNMVYLLESHRGRALGSALLDTWERAMTAHGHPRVMTSTASDERAQHLYRRRSYVDRGVLILPDEVAELLLVKDITGAPR